MKKQQEENWGDIDIGYAKKIILDNKKSINKCKAGSYTYLHLACKQGADAPIIILLIEAGANINAKDKNGNTPLHLAAEFRNYDAACALINANAIVNARNYNKRTPLHYANDKEMIKLLLRHGAIVEARGFDGETVLHYYCKGFHSIEAIDTLVNEGEANVHSKTRENNTALHLLANSDNKNNKDAIDILHKAGADLNAINYNGETPLHLAVENYTTGKAERLIKLGANVKGKGMAGGEKTILHYLLYEGKYKTIPVQLKKQKKLVKLAILLINKGAETQARDANGVLPLELALHIDDASLVQRLIEADAEEEKRFYASEPKFVKVHTKSIDTETEDGVPLLCKAARICSADVMRVLLKSGADFSVWDREKENMPLHYAVMYNHFEVVKVLIEEGKMNVLAKNRKGETPKDLAEHSECGELMKLLQDETKKQKEQHKKEREVHEKKRKENYRKKHNLK